MEIHLKIIFFRKTDFWLGSRLQLRTRPTWLTPSSNWSSTSSRRIRHFCCTQLRKKEKVKKTLKKRLKTAFKTLKKHCFSEQFFFLKSAEIDPEILPTIHACSNSCYVKLKLLGWIVIRFIFWNKNLFSKSELNKGFEKEIVRNWIEMNQNWISENPKEEKAIIFTR